MPIVQNLNIYKYENSFETASKFFFENLLLLLYRES